MEKMSYWEKHELLRIIMSKKPQQWEDIARCYGWISGLGGGLKGNELHAYIMFGLQRLKQEKYISVNITYNSTRFDSLALRPKGKYFVFLYPIGWGLYWMLTVGIVSAAAIATLWPIIAKLFKE